VNAPRYASITADLLARKGEAQPWSESAKAPLAWEAPSGDETVARAWRSIPHGAPQLAPSSATLRNLPPRVTPEPPRVQAPPQAQAVVPPPPLVAAAHDWKKCSVRMSHHDYERLGILAVKLNKTRHGLLQEAVDRMLGEITQNYGNGCACLGEERQSAGCCRAESSEHRAPRV
jgi:hypothetical protein